MREKQAAYQSASATNTIIRASELLVSRKVVFAGRPFRVFVCLWSFVEAWNSFAKENKSVTFLACQDRTIKLNPHPCEPEKAAEMHYANHRYCIRTANHNLHQTRCVQTRGESESHSFGPEQLFPEPAVSERLVAFSHIHLHILPSCLHYLTSPSLQPMGFYFACYLCSTL